MCDALICLVHRAVLVRACRPNRQNAYLPTEKVYLSATSLTLIHINCISNSSKSTLRYAAISREAFPHTRHTHTHTRTFYHPSPHTYTPMHTQIHTAIQCIARRQNTSKHTNPVARKRYLRKIDITHKNTGDPTDAFLL